MTIDENKIKDLYLDLMKKALTFMLWPEPGLPMEIYNKRPVLAFISRVLAKTVHVRLATLPPQEQRRIEGRVWPALAHTMIGLKRLDNIQFCVESILKDDIPGDFIETGAWRGGACIFMKAVLTTYGIKDKRIFRSRLIRRIAASKRGTL